MSASVKIFHSGMPGAPVLSGTPGSLIGVLDACLVNGWGSQTVDSIVISGGIATVTRGAGHPFEVDAVAEISGATVTGGVINGQRKVLSANSTSYTFDATGIANQTATGTPSHKLAAAGWGKPFSDTNLAAYRSADVTSTRFFLRVNDSNNYSARVNGFETMSDVNSGTGRFPTVALQTDGELFWVRSNSADATARNWIVVANERFMYWMASQQPGMSNYSASGMFGDFLRVGSNDVFNCIIHGFQNEAAFNGTGSRSDEFDSRANPAICSAREYFGLGGAAWTRSFYPTFIGATSGYRSGENSSDHIAFPNDLDGSVYLSPWNLCTTTAPGAFRGRIPGLFAFPQRVGTTGFPSFSRISGVVGYPGKRFITVTSGSGAYAFDVTGPWA